MATSVCPAGHVGTAGDRFCMTCGRPHPARVNGKRDARVVRTLEPTAIRPELRVQTAAPLEARSVDMSDGFVMLGENGQNRDRFEIPSLRAISRRTWQIVAFGLLGLFLVIASSTTFMQWQRADRAESSLAIANTRIADQDKRISELNGEVSSLNGEVDDLASDVSKAQDKAAVNGMRADRYEKATYELARASDLMHQAVESIALLMSAIADGDFFQAQIYGERAQGQMEAARQHESNALAAIGG